MSTGITHRHRLAHASRRRSNSQRCGRLAGPLGILGKVLPGSPLFILHRNEGALFSRGEGDRLALLFGGDGLGLAVLLFARSRRRHRSILHLAG